MHPFPFPEPARVAFSGDWHMNLARVEQVLYQARNHGADVIVQLGDFGIWDGPTAEHYLDTIDRIAGDLRLPVVFVDGNHENFDVLESHPVDAHGLRKIRTNIFHAPRNLRWQWGALRFCAFGGATSLDRPGRVAGLSWWPQESQTILELDGLVASGEVDVLLTHDCPAGVPIPGITHRAPSRDWSPAELERAWQHRERFALAVGEVAPTHIFHGHFHRRYEASVNAFGTVTTVNGLGDDNATPEDLTMILDLSELEAQSFTNRNLPV